MSEGKKSDDTRTRETDFAAMWSSDGLTRSMAPTATGLPVDLPFLFSPGQRFGGYEIVRPLGKGGMGQVYEAEELDSGRRIALKLLSRGLGDDEERERFLSEGRLAASLSHPNCVYVFGASEIQGFPVIAMELVPQGTLKDLVVPGTPMTAAAAADAILQVVAGLDAAALLGILHRDIKPSNCFVHRDGRVLVGDFGLSVAAAGRSASPGTLLGTPGFASPEQLRGDPLDVRSDIYSVGATLFYLLAGRPPFDDRNTTDRAPHHPFAWNLRLSAVIDRGALSHRMPTRERRKDSVVDVVAPRGVRSRARHVRLDHHGPGAAASPRGRRNPRRTRDAPGPQQCCADDAGVPVCRRR